VYLDRRAATCCLQRVVVLVDIGYLFLQCRWWRSSSRSTIGRCWGRPLSDATISDLSIAGFFTRGHAHLSSFTSCSAYAGRDALFGWSAKCLQHIGDPSADLFNVPRRVWFHLSLSYRKCVILFSSSTSKDLAEDDLSALIQQVHLGLTMSLLQISLYLGPSCYPLLRLVFQ
jgi:hypothetical protein